MCSLQGRAMSPASHSQDLSSIQEPAHVTSVVGGSGSGTNITTSTSVFLCQSHSTNAPY